MNEASNSVNELEQGDNNLLVQQVLLGKKVETCQTSNLFKNGCKSTGKICKVIVDGGSTNNLVVEEMVQKLGLKILKHPYPYRIDWLQGKHDLQVTE